MVMKTDEVTRGACSSLYGLLPLEEQTVESEPWAELLEFFNGTVLSVCSNVSQRCEIKQNFKTFQDFSRVAAF